MYFESVIWNLLSTSNQILLFKIVILHCAIQGGCTTACIHTHTGMHVPALPTDTNFWPDDQNGQTQNVSEFILILVTVVLNEITWCTLEEE